jgi:DNA sulfur modification protein DndB
VARKDIIALDEVDPAAIITRDLVDGHPWFSKGQVDVDRFSMNLPPGDSSALLTLGGLYDLVSILLPQIMAKEDKEELKLASRIRLDDEKLISYKNLVVEYFGILTKLDAQLEAYFQAANFGEIARTARQPSDARLLFRPIGLSVVTKAMAQIRKQKSLAEAQKLINKIPVVLSKSPYNNVIWDSSRGKIISSGSGLAVKLLVYMLGIDPSTDTLRAAYAKALDKPIQSVRLPARIV